ncbi:MAG: cupin domain-containing protein [Desulfobacteraceae bacterium]|nr:MAG: cupin domain-containing protein [Desulfobacteraceae bacterium]
MNVGKTKNEGAHRAGDGRYIFDLEKLGRMDAGPGYSSANGPVIEGDRIQVGLITLKRGTGARPHSHPNEQWIYLLKGKARVSVDNQPESAASAGMLIYLPADVVHTIVALPQEDVVFFTCKDMSHGIIGKAADGTMSGPAYGPGFESD